MGIFTNLAVKLGTPSFIFCLSQLVFFVCFLSRTAVEFARLRAHALADIWTNSSKWGCIHYFLTSRWQIKRSRFVLLTNVSLTMGGGRSGYPGIEEFTVPTLCEKHESLLYWGLHSTFSSKGIYRKKMHSLRKVINIANSCRNTRNL